MCAPPGGRLSPTPGKRLRPGSAYPSGMKTSIRRSAWVLGIAAVVAASLLTACGGDATATESGEGWNPAEVRAEAVRVYESFAGTQDQQNAGLVVRAHALNGAMDGCLDERGYPQWDWSLARTYASPYDPLRPTEWFAELGDKVYSENEMAMRGYVAAEAEMNADVSRDPRYEQAIDECLAETPQPSDSDAHSVSAPAQTPALVEAWRTTMHHARDDIGGDIGVYYQCMEDASIPVLDNDGLPYGGEESSAKMASEAAKAGPVPTSAQDPATYSDKWKHFLAEEEQIIDADVGCRKDVYDEGITRLGPVIAQFETDHADEIAKAGQGWEQITERAAELGYHGQSGPLGK